MSRTTMMVVAACFGCLSWLVSCGTPLDPCNVVACEKCPPNVMAEVIDPELDAGIADVHIEGDTRCSATGSSINCEAAVPRKDESFTFTISAPGYDSQTVTETVPAPAPPDVGECCSSCSFVYRRYELAPAGQP